MATKKKESKGKRDRRPSFLDSLSDHYRNRHSNVVLLTGNIDGIYYCDETDDHVPLEQLLFQTLNERFHVATMDIASSLSFFDSEDETTINSAFERRKDLPVDDRPKETKGASKSISILNAMIDETKLKSVPQLVLLRQFLTRVRNARKYGDSSDNLKPTCIIIRYAGSYFPNGTWDKLSENDRRSLVAFLGIITDPNFLNSTDLIILVNETRTEVSEKILKLSNVAHIELPLPTQEERKHFIREFKAKRGEFKLHHELSQEKLADLAAGLTLTSLEDMLEISMKTGEPITQGMVLKEVNKLIQDMVGDTIKVIYPDHSPKDVIGYKKESDTLIKVLRRCDNPDTATASIILSGPNGAGKTFLAEAYAHACGRIVIRLANMRSSLFGGTDRAWEVFEWFVRTFGKIAILVDEAHTALPSVQSSSGELHPTESRLQGKIRGMQSKPEFRGKIVWFLMTSRPDLLDSDTKSRSKTQMPIFDLYDEPRKQFVKEMFRRKGIKFDDEELGKIINLTAHFSNRDFNDLVGEVLAEREENKSEILPSEVLQIWNASKAIITERRAQCLIAAQHCSYPALLPEEFSDPKKVQDELYELKYKLGWAA